MRHGTDISIKLIFHKGNLAPWVAQKKKAYVHPLKIVENIFLKVFLCPKLP